MTFSVDVFQNEYLPEQGREVNAIVTVTGSGTATPAAPASDRRVEVIIVDTSGSMNYPPTKLAAAKQATAVAIDTLRDDVLFAVVAGSHVAHQIYPAAGVVPATPSSRAQAKAALALMRGDGGTAIGQWLLHAQRLVAGYDDAIRHAILLTDGNNQHETAEELDRVLTATRGAFTVDCRGVGTDWQVAELRRVATALLGTVDIVAEPAGLADDFRAMTAASMDKTLADVALRLWTPQGATVRFVKQVAPDILDLTSRRVESGPRTGDYPTGSWGGESRDYHVCVEVPPAAVGDRMLAGRVSMVLPDGTALGQGMVLAVWTDDEGLSTRINKEVAHYTGQGELAEAIQEGLAARKSGDVERATAKLGRAVALANRLGNEDTAKLLAKVVDVEDPVRGTVRLRAAVTGVDEMTLDTRSTKTARVRRPTTPDGEG
ncbi:MAG TPA: VWA domain-containing protein [Pseudonocardiaceae bacterium]